MRSLILGAAAALALGATAQAGVIGTATVDGTANPFLAGQPNGTSCCGGDMAPNESPVLALTSLSGGEVLTFSTTGGVNYEPGPVSPTADGGYAFSMTADYGTGISGPQNVNVNGLLGVFLTAATPSGPAPASLNSGLSFAALAPGLDQIFWIGDGLTGTGSGAVQQFVVPTGATQLYLGVADGFGWNNNVGSIDVTISSGGGVPEPASWALMILGFAGAGAALRRRRSLAAA